MIITSEQLKALRDKTGISVMQCKKALEEAEGDEEKAMIILKTKSAEQASKKADRAFGAGVVEAYIHTNGLMGSMIELASETDFVSNNAEFKALAKDIAMQVVAVGPQFLKESDVTEEAHAKAIETLSIEGHIPGEEEIHTYIQSLILLNQAYIKNPDITIQGMLDTAMQKFGERIEIIKFVRFEIGQ